MNFAEYKKLKDSGKDTGRTKQSTKQTPNYIQEISGKSAEEIKNNRKREQSGEVLPGKDTSIKTPGAMVKGASFASKREKRKVRQTKTVDAVEKRAGSAIASGNAGILSGNAKNISVLANAIAKSRKSAENVRTPVAATKGSVFVNKGYNPQNKSKSAKETKRLETAAQKTNDFARKMQEKESTLDTEGKEGLGKVGSAAYDLGKVGAQLAADATAGLLVPGGGLASVASRSFGQGVMQAEDEGKSGARAVLYGAGNAAIEAGTEKLTAAAKPLKAIYGAGVVDNVLGKLTKKLGSSAKGRSALATIAKAAGGEAAEEALADVLQVPLQRAVLENGAKFDADWAANTAYDALLGGVMGGVLGGGSVAVDRAQNRSTNRAKTMADAMQRAREKNQKKSTGSAPPVMQSRAAQTTPAQTTPTQQETTQNLPKQNTNVNRQQSATAQEAAADPTHIDNRSSVEISSRNVNAFQYDHPEIRQYYRKAAEDLLTDADLSLQSGTTRRKERTMQGNKRVQEIIASPIVRQAMSHGLTRENIIRGAEDIIQDEGAENNANAKRVEQVLDRMVEQGYSTMAGRTVQPNADYVAAKQAIPGGAQRTAAGSWEAYLEENRLSLETGEVTEDQLRAEYEALQRGGGSGTMNANGGAGYGREGQVSESRGTAGRIGREMPERGETDPGGIFGGIQSNGNAIRNENTGRFSLAGQYGVEVNPNGGAGYGEEITARDTGRNIPENGQRGRIDRRGETTGAFSYDRPVVSRAREYAREYGVQVTPVSDEVLTQRGHQAGTGFTKDSTIYMSENMPGEAVRQFISHEVVHTMKQNGFEPYLQFTQRTESRLNPSANTETVLANLMDHRGYQGVYDDLDLNQRFTVMDELNAALYGGYRSQPDKTISLARTIMDDPESYFSELSGIMEQYKTRNDGLGAADRGSLNSPYENLQAQSTRFYPEGANAARPVDVPMYDADGNPISKSASTVLGAKAIPDEVIPQIEQMIADGEMSYTTVKDQDSLRRARTTVERDGFDGAMQEFRTSVNSGKVSKDIMTLGQTLLNTAANNRDGHAVAEILTLYQSMNTNLGQAMQAASILRKLEPESQLYGIRRMVDNLNDVLAKEKMKANSGNLYYTQDVVDTIQEQYDIAKQLLTDIAESFNSGKHGKADLQKVIAKYPQYEELADYFNEIDSYIAGEKQNGWVETLGRELASKAGQRASEGSPKERTIYETISSDLNAFMNQYVDSHKATKKPRTAAERIRDYFNNRNEYARAWSVAQNQLREKYRNDQLMLDRLDDFLNESISYTGGATDTVLMRAVADSAIEEGIKAKEFTVRRDFDSASMVSQISDRLIQSTGAIGADAVVIRDAVSRYVSEKLPGNKQTSSDILDRDIQSSMRNFGLRLSEILTQNAKSKDEIAKRISDALISEYHISKDGAAEISSEIATKFTDMVKDASRKKLDSIFKDRPKREQKSAMERFESLANLGAFLGEYNLQATEKVFGQSVQLDPVLVQKFTEQDTQEGRDAVMQEIYQNVASQVPSTWKEKWDAWRYLAMLGNPRTHIRNIVGNAAFQPVRFLKNEIAAGMEAGLNKLGMNIERTKSFSASPALYRAAWNDYANAKDILGGSKYNEIETAIEKNRRILPGILETARVKNSAALEAEDAIAKRITYADSLAGYLKANGITAEQFMNGEADSGIVNKARNYAAQEALKATYQDKNAFSNRVVDIVSKTGVVGDAIIPFKRTPANILVRSIEYSPIGAVKAVTYDLAKVKSGEKTAAQVIDAAAAGLAGTGLFALGAYMFANGLLTVAQGDDKEDKWAQLLGHQGYALELPDGTSVTIDWLAPDSLPFFMGAEMMSSAGENGWSIESIWNALKSVANPMLNLSMLQSVNDLIDSVKYAESSPLAAMVPSAIVSYFSQAVPTIGGQIERTAGDKRMTTYTEKDGKLPTDFQYAIGKVSAKIPGWDYQQVPYIDEWGREEQTGTPFQRAFNNFLNPAYTSQVDMDKVEKSIQSVYDATGEKSVFPDKAERTLTINNEDKNLTASEYEKYAKKLGKERYTLLKEAVNSDAYGKLSNAEKAEFISEVYSYSKAMTEHDLFGKEISKRWYTEAKESGDVLGAIRDHVLYTVNGSYSDKAKTAVEDIGITLDQYAAMRSGLDADGNGAVSQSEAKAYLDGQDFSRDQKSQLWKIINKSWKSNPYG